MRKMQDAAIEIFLQQIAEQIAYMERVGVYTIRVAVPQFVNRVPMDRDKAYRKIKDKLVSIGYRVFEEPGYTLRVSWLMT